MTDTKRRRPVTVCTVCGAPGYDANLHGKRCGRKIDGKRCSGSTNVAIGEKDWEECPSCGATGYASEKRCDQCSGSGWIYVRGLG